jgi:hypothetical protein
MKQWFYLKNDLVKREDVKDVIQRPIHSRFGFRRPSIVNSEKAQACLVAFNTVCSYIGTSDLVQEHIAFKVWSLVNEFEMPKEPAPSSTEGDLVYLKYTDHYRVNLASQMMNGLRPLKLLVRSCWGLIRRLKMNPWTLPLVPTGREG